ncbi:MAG TPA: AMP-binding protein, partial [Burkholderiaceae bacterium]
MSIPSSRRQTIADLLRRTRQRYPGRTAIRCGSVQWSYAEFDDICTRLAAGLQGLGVAVGDRVAVVSRNSHAFAALRYAVARLGAVLVPINFMLNADEVRYILDHAGATMLCVDSASAPVALQAAQGTAVLHQVWLPAEEATEPVAGLIPWEALLAGAGTLPELDIDADALAQIIYTSGTESRPKGAMLTHAAVIAEYVTCLVDAEISHDDVLLHALPLYHCAQLDVFLGPAVYVGATSVITARPTADNLLALLAGERITSFFAPPTVWIALLRAPQFDGADLTRLTKGYYGASIMPVEVLKELARRLPATRLWNLYGQTEIAPVATVLKPADQLRKAGSAGRAALNVETRIVDDQMLDVPIGAIGEIV